LRRYLGKTLIYVMLIAAIVVSVFPFYWVASTSIKYDRDHFVKPPVYVPQDVTLKHYQVIFEQGAAIKAGPHIKNSFIIAFMNMILVLLLTVPAAYAFARYRIGGNKLTFSMLVARMLPPVVLVIPLFLVYRTLGLRDTHIGLVLAYTTFNAPLAVWLLISFFEDFPTEIQDAALVDGCTEVQALLQVVIPLIAPGIAVVALFCFLTGWNDLIFVLALGGKNTQTLNLLMVNLLNAPSSDMFGPAASVVTIGILPPFLVTLFLQRYLVTGLSLGGVKG
jgi:multiple sugar transport system permease protein